MPSTIETTFAEKLKKLSSDFEFLIHITSHDLRDPLRQAKIYINELCETLNGTNKQKLTAINSCLDEVLEKISILRDFSYIANDKETHSSVNVDRLVDDILQELINKINSKNILVTKNKLPTNIQGNEKHLRLLFLYLIDNAIAFRCKNRKLKIIINVTEEEGFWHFTIEDNGVGLEIVYRELVFVLFQKIDNTTKHGNYGVGLAFAKKIVENHGGKIWYESDGESGTNFHFTIMK